MNTNAKPTPEIASCGGPACSHCADDVAVAAPVPPAAQAAGVTTFRIATMDCASEEGEIRRALEPLAGIRRLSFQLGARTLTIDANPKDLPQALEAIRKAGFDPKPLTPTAEHGDAGEGAHDHDHGFEVGIGRMGAALGMAIAAEAVSVEIQCRLVL